MKCIISDFDGTLFCSNFFENINKVNEFVKQGNIFIIATGRTYESIKEEVTRNNISYEYLICSDGACIYDKNENLIYENFFVDKQKNDIIEKIKENKKILCVKYDNNIRIIDDYKCNISRILIDCDDEDYKFTLCKELNESIDYIYSYISPNWINISLKENTKLNAIKYLENNNLISNIYTIGNDVNDYDMLEAYNGYIINNDIKKFKNISSVYELIELIK